MPIKGLSEQRRMPRLGKIHLGYRDDKKKGAPTATDYFVCPQEVEEVLGERPKELPVMIPVEDEEYWASQYYRCYSRTRGLVCKGDGENCNRMVDTETGEKANRDSKDVVWKNNLPCAGRECIYYKDKQCREMMCLQFLLPDVPGVGVWQIDTNSINSIRNINSSAELIRGLCGRIRMIPLILVLEKQEVVNPDDGKKKNVHVLNLRHRQSLQQLLSDTQKPIYELLAPAPAEDEVPMDIVAEPTDEVIEKETDDLCKDGGQPQKVNPDMTYKELLDWVASHGKQYTKTWLLKNSSMAEDEIRAKPAACLAEMKELTGWK